MNENDHIPPPPPPPDNPGYFTITHGGGIGSGGWVLALPVIAIILAILKAAGVI